jgi:hypothetical protein
MNPIIFIIDIQIHLSLGAFRPFGLYEPSKLRDGDQIPINIKSGQENLVRRPFFDRAIITSHSESPARNHRHPR